MPRLFAALFLWMQMSCSCATYGPLWIAWKVANACWVGCQQMFHWYIYRRFVYRTTYTILLSYPSMRWSILILLSTSQVSGWSLIFHWVLSGNPTCVANEGMESWSVGLSGMDWAPWGLNAKSFETFEIDSSQNLMDQRSASRNGSNWSFLLELWSAVGVMGAMVLSIGNSDKYGVPCAMMPWCHGQSSLVNCPNTGRWSSIHFQEWMTPSKLTIPVGWMTRKTTTKIPSVLTIRRNP